MNERNSQIVRVRVTPEAKKEYVEEGADGVFRITVKEPRVHNSANNRVRELLAHHFVVPVEQVRIVSGHHHETKRILIFT